MNKNIKIETLIKRGLRKKAQRLGQPDASLNKSKNVIPADCREPKAIPFTETKEGTESISGQT